MQYQIQNYLMHPIFHNKIKPNTMKKLNHLFETKMY